MGDTMKKYHGWLFRKNKKLVVQLRTESGGHDNFEFKDTIKGSQEAAQFITERLKSDSWQLEPQPIKALGCRILTVTITEESTNG